MNLSSFMLLFVMLGGLPFNKGVVFDIFWEQVITVNPVTLLIIIPWLIIVSTYWIVGYWLLPEKEKRDRIFTKTGVSFSACIWRVLFNQLFIIPIGLYLLFTINNVQMTAPNREVTYLWEVVLIMAVGELFYYLSHRLLHHKSLYKWIHKKHHTFKTPVSLASMYSHPLEILFHDVFSLLGPCYILGCNLLTAYFVILYISIDTLIDHTDVDKERVHYLHHELTNYNFGSMWISDWLFGTTAVVPTKGNFFLEN
jgi:methylsterol monooxygenase